MNGKIRLLKYLTQSDMTFAGKLDAHAYVIMKAAYCLHCFLARG